MNRLLMLLAVALLLLPFFPLSANSSDQTLPVVKSADLPTYPHLARMARIEGTVVVTVKTNGEAVANATASGAHKLLLDATEANVKTWRFYPHRPQTFMVTFIYKLDTPEVFGYVNPTIQLNLPTRIEIHTKMHTVETTTAN